jgi:hypothetical protein
MCGPMKAFLSLWVDQGKFSCLYGWTYESFPVFMGGPAEAFLSLWVDLRKLSCLQGWTFYSMSLHFMEDQEILSTSLVDMWSLLFSVLDQQILPAFLVDIWSLLFSVLDQQILPTSLVDKWSLHRKKRFTSFPSPAGMSLTKLPLGRNRSVMTSLFPPRESLVVTSRLGTGNSRTFFLRCTFFCA